MKDNLAFATSVAVVRTGDESKYTNQTLATNVQTTITSPEIGFQIFGTRIKDAIETIRGTK